MVKRLFLLIKNNKLIKYVIVGGIATLVDWVIFYILGIVFGIYYQVALAASFLFGSLTNYGLNKIFTFENKSKKISKQIGTHLTISVFSLLINMGIMFIMVESLSFTKMFSRIFTTCVMLIVNYFLHKNITFNNKFFGEEIERS